MIRLIKIEYFKLKNTRYFWVLSLLFLAFMIIVPVGAKFFLNYLGGLGETMGGMSLSDIPLFDFVDIWQNLTWVYKMFSILIGFISIISISNEFSNTTLRQGIIDGLSRKEFLLSKIGMILLISAVFSFIAFIIGLISGMCWSPVTNVEFIFKNIQFIPAYFLHLVAFQIFCLFIGMLIKKSGISIALIIFYSFMIEPITYAVMRFDLKWEVAAELLPIMSIGNLIRIPFTKYALQETQTHIAMLDVAIVLVYLTILLFGIYSLLKKRDL